MELPGIILKKGKETSTLRYHHWIFSGAIARQDKELNDGDLVQVLSHHNQFLGIGHYQKKGSISVRLLSFTNEMINAEFWKKSIGKARYFRRLIGLPSEKTNCYRLVHGEGDQLPGLVIDIYDDAAVVLCYTQGMANSAEDIARAISDNFGNEISTIYIKIPDAGINFQKNPYLLGGDKAENTVLEHGNKFIINWEEGQKSGFFLDQRENRKLVGELARDKTVLNTFSYSGGFSIYALNAQAQKVTSVDISDKAIALTDQNVRLNGGFKDTHKSVEADVLKFIKEHKEKYDVVVLDPPAFAKHLSARHNAVQAYKRLNKQAFQNIKPGGFLLTFSCSQVVDKVLFTNTVKSAAIEAGRPVKIVKYLSQPEDHPINIYHPETEYLKGLFLYVE